jgi:pteridine reductase
MSMFKKEEHTVIQNKKQADKVALITGSARRIGASIAEACHRAGYRVAIHCYQSLSSANDLAAGLNALRPQSASVFAADLSDPDTAGELISSVIAWGGRLDLLVNNASLFIRSDCLSWHNQDWQSLFAVNAQTPFALSLAAYPTLAEHQGNIINITDIHAERPLKGYAVYCQSKAALLMQTKVLAREFAPNVRVNAVAPGAIMWPEHSNVLTEAQQQKIISQTPLKRYGDPTYIAQAVLSLVANPFITGQVLNVDGGRSIS